LTRELAADAGELRSRSTKVQITMPQPVERDLEESRKRLCDWLGKKLPAADGLRISELTGPSETGFSSDTLLFTAEYTEAGSARGEDLVVRLRPTGFPIFPQYDIAQQYRVMKLLGERTDVPVPRMRWLEESEGPLGTPFYVMDRVEGIVPTDRPPYHTGGWVFELSPEEREELWWNGLEAMTRVHKLDWQALGFDFLDAPESSQSQIVRQLDDYEHFIRWGLTPDRYPLIASAMRWLRENAPEGEVVRLCWGDSRPANMIFRDLQCVAVIDWEMVTLGNPVEDLAWWTTIDRCLSEGIGVSRIPGIPDRDATLARWEALTGLTADPVPYYEVFAAFRFSVIMARIGVQMKHYGILPPEHEMDIHNLASTILARLLEEVAA
jgi:aminoglycoside phosphotransferase (APT) family kinase protein